MIKIKGKRILAEVQNRASEIKGILLQESKAMYFEPLKVIQVGEDVEDIKEGDSVWVDYYSYTRMQPFTFDKEEGINLTIDIDAAQQSNNKIPVPMEKYKLRLINYHDIIAHQTK